MSMTTLHSPIWQGLVDLRRQLHQIPEIGYEEYKTQALLLETIASFADARVQVQTWRTGIVVRVKGRIGKYCMGFRADIDGLSITEQVDVPFRSTHEGYMHACGHDMHMTIAIGVMRMMVAQPIEDDVVFIFQPAEEGPGGAQPMLQCAPFLAWKPDFMMALHIAPEYPVGTIATREGILFANTSELMIDLYGYGGHAAFPHHTIDTIVVVASLITQLQTIVSRNINPLDPAVITIGTIQGGTRQNIIADQVHLSGTIRTLTQASLPFIKTRIEALIGSLEQAYGVKAKIDYGVNYVQVHNDARETKQFMDWMRAGGAGKSYALIECATAMTGEDFGYFLQQIPGFMFWLGVDTPYGLHHAKIQPQEEAIAVGVDVVTAYLRQRSAQGNA